MKNAQSYARGRGRQVDIVPLSEIDDMGSPQRGMHIVRQEPLLISVRALFLSRCATQGVHEAAREVTGGSERQERVALLALLACAKTVSIRYGNQ
jgi:hypothetical protein